MTLEMLGARNGDPKIIPDTKNENACWEEGVIAPPQHITPITPPEPVVPPTVIIQPAQQPSTPLGDHDREAEAWSWTG